MTNQPSSRSNQNGEFGYSVNALVTSDGSRLEIPESGVVLIVGPNNAGKSQALKDIAHHLNCCDGLMSSTHKPIYDESTICYSCHDGA